MKNAITPLDAVQNSRAFRELMSSIRMRLSLGQTEINFDDFEMDFMIGRDFSGLDLEVALNEFRKKGWIVRNKEEYIYQFSAAPIETASLPTSTKPLSPNDCYEKKDAMEAIIRIINLQLGNKEGNRLITIYKKPFLCNFESDVLAQAIKQFEEVGWSISGSPNDNFYFQKL